MNIEKALQENNSFHVQPNQTPCHGSQLSCLTKGRILKSTLAVLLLGLLVLNSFQAIRGASPSDVWDHTTNWMELHGNLELAFGDETQTDVVDGSWTFNAFPEKKCTGTVISRAGTGIVNCQQINADEISRSISVPALANALRICLYPDDECSKNATTITAITGCAPTNTSYYIVKPRLEEC